MDTIHFGTSGWRDIIADGFTFHRVEAVARALARVLKHKGLARRGVLVGRDYRFLAERFARFAADVIADEGVTVYLTTGAAPTPALAEAIRGLGLAGGVNFTASHNPATYQGFKYSNAHGSPATKEEVAPIEAQANRLLAGGWESSRRRPAPVVDHDPAPAYFRLLATNVPFARLRRAALPVVTDPLFGAGRGYLQKAFRRAGCRVWDLHDEDDVLFGGRNPEPDAENLAEAVAMMRRHRAHLVVGTDGDADRFGIVDRDGGFLTPNEILALTVYLLVKHRRRRGRVVRSVVSSHLVDAVARTYGLEVEVVPVGFKYIGESMLRGGFLVGGEESGGLTIAGHVPEKDGILACLLMAELVIREGKPLRRILADRYREIGGAVLSDRINVKLTSPAHRETLKRRLAGFRPDRLAGRKVASVDTLDGTKYLLADGTWIAFRFSGTEPMARMYFEAGDAAGLKRLAAAGRRLLAG